MQPLTDLTIDILLLTRLLHPYLLEYLRYLTLSKLEASKNGTVALLSEALKTLGSVH